MTDSNIERKVWRCRYCGCKVARYQTVCYTCRLKLPLVRRLVAAGQLLRRRAQSGKK